MIFPAENPKLALDILRPCQAFPSEVDLVVIGGGIVGVCTAFFASRFGLRVALCEKGEIGAEQSSRNWGWIRQMGRDPVEIPLAIESLRLWRRFAPDHGVETGYRETGITYLARSRREVAEIESWAANGTAHDLPQRVMDGAQIAETMPGIAPGFKLALNTLSDGRAEPAVAAPAIARAAQKAGTIILTNCAVRGVETAAGRVNGVVTERGEIKCAAAVVAAGAWSRLFLGNLGINFPQLKILGSAARAAAIDGVPDMPVGAGNFSFRRRLDGGFTIALRNTNVAPILPDSFRLLPQFLPTLATSWHELRLRLGRPFFRELRMPRRWSLDAVTPFERLRTLDPEPYVVLNDTALVNLRRAFPAFAASRITHSWAGIIDATPDTIPVIAPLEAVPGLFLSSGCSGHGFGIGTGAGKLTAQLVAGLPTLVDPMPFRFARFFGCPLSHREHCRRDAGSRT